MRAFGQRSDARRGVASKGANRAPCSNDVKSIARAWALRPQVFVLQQVSSTRERSRGVYRQHCVARLRRVKVPTIPVGLKEQRRNNEECEAESFFCRNACPTLRTAV